MKIFHIVALAIISSLSGCHSKSEQQQESNATPAVQGNNKQTSTEAAQDENPIEGTDADDTVAPATGFANSNPGDADTEPETDKIADAVSSSADGPKVFGKWKIETCSFYGKSDPERRGDLLSIASSGPSSIERAGQLLALELTLRENDNADQYDIMFAISEDNLSMGGAGPRPGLIQLSDNENLEMLVAGSASGKRPANFSAAEKKLHIYYLATPAPKE